MANRWSWDVPGFEPWKLSPTPSVDGQDESRVSVVTPRRRYSITSGFSWDNQEMTKQALASKVSRLNDKVKLVKNDFGNLRQEAIDLQDYSNAKLERARRYLGVLADKTRKLDQAALETQARISPLIFEKKRLFNELLSSKGNVKAFCRVRPLFEEEGASIVEFPDDCTIRINNLDDSISNSKKDYEFDKVFGPHVGQAEFFSDVQPFVQSALDGFNVSIFSYGQTSSGKTHTMEGSSHDRGLYARCFEELYDLANSDSTSSSSFSFSVTVSELYNEQVTDLLFERNQSQPKILLGASVEATAEKVDNPLAYSKLLKAAFLKRGNDSYKFQVSHLIITIHIEYNNLINGESLYSKLSLVDLAGHEGSITEEDSGDRVTDLLYVMKSLSALGDVLSSVTSKKDDIFYENSQLTTLLADSIGGSSKTLLILNVYPNCGKLSEILSTLNFGARARNTTLSLGNRDTIKKWKDVANDARKELQEKEKELQDMKLEVAGLKLSLKDANDQCVLLFNEVQKASKVSFAAQSEIKSECLVLGDKLKVEMDKNNQLRNQIGQLLQGEKDLKGLIQQRDSSILELQGQFQALELQHNQTLQSVGNVLSNSRDINNVPITPKLIGDDLEASLAAKRLEKELKERDTLIEKLHVENEKLFERLTEKTSSVASHQNSSPLLKQASNVQSRNSTNSNRDLKTLSANSSFQSNLDKADGSLALVRSISDIVKSTPAGEYLTSALNGFDVDQYDSLVAISDGANKLLMLVLAAVIKAGASREHEILAEIRDAVFAFVRKMEPKRVMDTMLVSRVRILYIRSLLARSPELQSIKVSSIDSFLEKAAVAQSKSSSRNSSRGNSPGRSPVRYGVEQIVKFRVNVKPEKKSKLSSVVLRMRGLDHDSWRQQVTGGKLREIQEEAKHFAVGNKTLAALFVHTPAGELQRQIRLWLAENYDFLSVTGDDTSSEATGHLELLSTAIMDGWMAGLGAAKPPSTDALGQLLGDYARRVYSSQLQHLKDIAGTLATEDADDPPQVTKLRSALESVDHKRRKILQQLRSDTALLTTEEGGIPIQLPSTAAEDARLASLIALDGVLKHVKEISSQISGGLSRSRKRSLLTSLADVEERMPSLLDVDHPLAHRMISQARRSIESAAEEEESGRAYRGSSADTDVAQWNVLQFNTGATAPFIIKCGANSQAELVIKADARVHEPKGGEIIRVVPRPFVLESLSLEQIKEQFSHLPEALGVLSLARTADGTRARYSRLYKTLAMKVPSLRDAVA